MEFAQGKKRSADEMASGNVAGRGAAREAMPNVSGDAPSLKVSGVPPGTSSDELHQAVTAAGCRGNITDVYIPKGDRGFGFVRFAGFHEAEAAVTLQVIVRGTPLSLEISVAPRKGRKEMAGQEYGADAAYDGGYGFGPAMAFGGYGPPQGKGKGYGGGPYGGKGSKGYW
jgi:hypothetical protein